MDCLKAKVLNDDDIATLRQLLTIDRKNWLDGRLTAGELAAKVKKNKQLNPASEECIHAVKLVENRIRTNHLIKSFALIKRLHSVSFSRCDPGDAYGWHVDNPFTKAGRRDLSFTLFLSDTDEYQGGELAIQGIQDSSQTKLPAGDIIVYPSSSLHSVCEVSTGIRYVCIGWIESYVRSHEDRLMLFNLDAGAKGLLARHGRSDELDLIFQAYSNAVRRLSS